MIRHALTALHCVATMALGAGALASTVALVAERSAPPTASPAVLSIRMMHEDEAHDMWHEALSLGESVCLTELNDGGLRYWVHTCAHPRFTDGGAGA
jgi:hypothetical protein